MGLSAVPSGSLLLRCLSHELKSTEHIAVVGDGYALHTVFGGLLEHGRNIGGPVEQGVLCVAVQVDELRHYLFMISDV